MALIVKGNRRVSMTMELLAVLGNSIQVRHSTYVEDELVQQDERVLFPTDSLTQSYRMEIDEPLTDADRRALQRERERK